VRLVIRRVPVGEDVYDDPWSQSRIQVTLNRSTVVVVGPSEEELDHVQSCLSDWECLSMPLNEKKNGLPFDPLGSKTSFQERKARAREMEMRSMNDGFDQHQRVTTALLLAAGTGSRLQPLTSDAPKCLTEINGIPVLARQIRYLRQWGFKRLVVVVGYLGECIREFLADHAAGLTVDFVTSPRYRTTNNLYSLWLARKEIREAFLLLECDLVFDASLLGDMLHPDKIAVSRRRPWMNGTTVTVDPFQRVTTVRVSGGAVADDFSYKNVNICSLSLASGQRVTE